ncbi:MAG: endoribonuclease MazF [Xanthobacteraceae bacterium]|jgi:mRNA interferase MazF
MASLKKTGSRRSTGARPSATKSGSPYCPDAGDFIWIEFDPTKGHEQRGRRPALVLSPRAYNSRVGLCVASPITSQGKGYPFEVPIPSGHGVAGVVLADQMRSLSWPVRNASLAGRAPADLLEDVREKIAALIEIS